MNSERATELWLLVESGEASEKERTELAHALEQSPALREQMVVFEWICSRAQDNSQLAGPTDATLSSVVAAARDQASRVSARSGMQHLLVVFSAKRIARVAAVCLVLLGSWLALRQGFPSEADSEGEQPVSWVAAWVLVATGDIEDADGADGDIPTDVDQVAEKLMEYQGFSDGESLSDELVNFLLAEPSIAPQAHSIPGSPAERCG